MNEEQNQSQEPAVIPDPQSQAFIQQTVERLQAEMDAGNLPDKGQPKPENQQQNKQESKSEEKQKPDLSALKERVTKSGEARKSDIELQRVKTENEQLKEAATKLQKFSELIDKDPSAALAVLGKDPKQFYAPLTEQMLKDPITPEQQQAQEALRIAKEAQQEASRLQNELNQRDNQTVLNNFLQDAKKYVDTNEKYELLRLQDNPQQLILDTVNAEYQSTGNLMTVEEAAESIEAYLEAEADRLFKADKIRKKLIPTEGPAQKPKTQSVKPASPTLKNSLTPSSGGSAKSIPKPGTPEYVKYAIENAQKVQNAQG